MAEVHLIGNILEARDFAEDRSLFAKWTLNVGSCWKALEGYTEGQTQLVVRSEKTVSCNKDEEVENPVICHPWSHPIDVHYVTKGLQGWPKFEFQLWSVDWMGKSNISAYGFMNVPTQPGYHELTCFTWRPVGDFRRRFIDYFTGNRLHLVNPADIVCNGLNRHVIQTQSTGSVIVQLTVVLKDFQEYGVDI